jgi:hypothetical protein
MLALARVDKPILRVLRNMIYAKHGYIFQSEDLSMYFNKFGWYTPSLRKVDHLFTELDKGNLDLIRAFEQMDDTIADSAKESDYVGYWHSLPYFASGPSTRFILDDNNIIAYGTNSMRELPLLHTIIGKYKIKGNVLEFQADQMEFTSNDADFGITFNGIQWENKDSITAAFNKPIMYRFPITLPVVETVHDLLGNTIQLETIRIENTPFYRIPDVDDHWR